MEPTSQWWGVNPTGGTAQTVQTTATPTMALTTQTAPSSAFLTPEQYSSVQQAYQSIQQPKPVGSLSSYEGQNIVAQDTQKLQNLEQAYTVQQGDTLSGIAEKHNASIDDISGYKSGDPNLIFPGELLNIKTGNPALDSMIQGISKTAQQGGMTPEDRAAIGSLVNTQAGITSATAAARAAMEAQDFQTMDFWVKRADDQRKQMIEQAAKLQEQMQPLRERALQMMTPGEREQQVAQELNTLRGQIDQRALQLQKDQLSEFEGQSMSFATGRAAALDFKESFARQEMALKEKNLLSELGLLQDARKMDAMSIEQQMSWLSEDFGMQTKIQERLDSIEEDLYNKARQLRADAQNQLSSFLSLLDGVDPKNIDDATRNQITTLAARSGIPSDLLFQALDVQHQRSVYEMAKQNIFGSASTGYFKYDPVTGETTPIQSPYSPVESSYDEATRLAVNAKGGTIPTDDTDESEFDKARRFLTDNPSASEEELRVALRERTKLSITDINNLLKERSAATPPPTVDDVKNQIVSVLSPMADTYSRKEAEEAATRQLKAAMGLKDNQELPKAYIEAIKDALVAVYGRTFMQSILPGGR